MKYNYDYAAEMEKIASSQEHQKLYAPMEKLAFSRDGQDVDSEVEREFEKSFQKTAGCECKDCGDSCDCDCHKKDTASADDGMTSSDDTATKSALDTVSGLMKISMQLEEQGFDRLAAASLMLAEYVVKEAKKKKETSKSKGKASDKSKGSAKSKASNPFKKKETDKSKKDKEKDKDKKSTKKSK